MGEQEGRDVVPAERNGRPLGVQVLDEVVHRDCGGGEGVSYDSTCGQKVAITAERTLVIVELLGDGRIDTERPNRASGEGADARARGHLQPKNPPLSPGA